ncbi:VPS9 domain protein, putative [Talaromyces stipitatus ATCC 10500]|uniref:VPS9 domain protein, putative n=1 Tax=Talaromyces stipitatus (strain ATCC 10500 / CBS 375.48 / QM 6759 / NRRL 1006) TaxID=441959 RepID=B8LUU6_TALSN|nr:VPS9 domain protein, putative [Talaromyces stipitatus ATCC 10500]EED24038.1 VPS9 domain protein, putative [Talaromyces stipitatus ATCC 10500]
MHPLNPFLRAFFRSTVPGQCVPVENHVLLVPTTESLFGSRDRDSNAYYSDLVSSEEFLGSHVLRISNPPGPSHKPDASNARDSRAKAKQVTTVNGRTVIVKDNSVYSNKGFKSLCQAQILSDVLYHTPNHNSQPWLIYYISKPLIGTYDPGRIVPAVPSGNLRTAATEISNQNAGDTSSIQKRDIKSFAELLSQFPMIARQMQPGLDRLFREFGKELGKPLPPPPSESPASLNKTEQWEFGGNDPSQADRLPFNSEEYFVDDEDLMRRSLETAVTAAIDLFRLVDKQQLSLLGATTDLTGPLVERLIERYIAQQVHETLLFPRLCTFRRAEDVELDTRIRQIEHIDVSQVGIAIEGGLSGKKELMNRLSRGVDEFRKMTDATCPQDMLDVLLATIKAITIADGPDGSFDSSEKQASAFTVNADILVSMLLVVVIRSQVRRLQARLLYMQHFIFVDDVESGEMGYALSTLEAVLTYLVSDYAPLRKASMRNKRLWQATKTGNIKEVRSILEPNENGNDEDFPLYGHNDFNLDTPNGEANNSPPLEQQSIRFVLTNGNSPEPHAETELESSPLEPPPLAHVFPFQTWTQPDSSNTAKRPRKRVSMDVSSISGSSVISLLSRTTTIASTFSGIEGDTSIETLSHTHDPAGDSVPMMAVESHQPGVLKYLLSLQEYYSIDVILEDTNRDGTTLLSAAVQHANRKVVDIITDFLLADADIHTISSYLEKEDVRGRTVAHYLFSAPYLMSSLGSLLPWQKKDKHGQTPLFAICRSYDHSNYQDMVNEALTVAQRAQDDGQPLRIGDHVDLKGNTLLHIVSDPAIITRILTECDCDPNATNEKKFTPLMVASKYGRVDLMRRLFADPRVDTHITESRGLTAIELAKDDEVRNRIDDMILFLNPAVNSGDATGRITTVVRSLFVEDATVRFILKSGAQAPLDTTAINGSTTYTITTCRRSFADFEHLARCLAVEHPASYIPSISEARSPFQIHSKPSRAILHDMQGRLDQFLRILLTHPTFATHEMLWEFFLMPELQPEMMIDRSQRKASVLYESIYDDYAPITPDGIRDTEQFVAHAQEVVRAVHANTRSVIRRGYSTQHAAFDFGDAAGLCASILSTFKPPSNAIPVSHIDTFAQYAAAMSTSSSDSSPLLQFLTTITSIQSTTTAVLNALSRPGRLIYTLSSTNRNLSRSRSSLASSSLPRKFNLNLSVLEESRQKNIRELEQKINDSEAQASRLSREISWNKDVVVSELAGWTSWRENVGRDAIRAFVRATVVQERERGRRLERCLRNIKELPFSPSSAT